MVRHQTDNLAFPKGMHNSSTWTANSFERRRTVSERSLDKKQIIAALAQSPHGKLTDYSTVALKALADDPDFYAHITAWNHLKGSIRDAKVALPVLGLMMAQQPEVLIENALAHLADLRPREFVRAIQFGWDIKAPTRMLKRLAIRYLRDLEADRHAWERTALQHRESLRWLYAQSGIPVRVKGGESALFHQTRKGKDRGLPPARFRTLASLPNLSPEEIAGQIDKYKIPFLIARGALGAKAKEPDVVLALMKRMSTSELVTNMKWLERVGVKTVPALRAALEEALGKAGAAKKQKRGAVLKATTAATVLADDEVLSGKLRVLQEKQIDHIAGIDGDWLVLADKSGSMEAAMDAGRLLAATLTRLVKGRVYLMFFDTVPRYMDATGMSYEALTAHTATISANGGTSIGCGVRYLQDKKLTVEGIAIVSDGCENAHPPFGEAYQNYVRALGCEPPTVYWYRCGTAFPPNVVAAHGLRAVQGQADYEIQSFVEGCKRAKIDLQTFDLRGGVDAYSVPLLAETMRCKRYELLDEIYSCKFRTLNEVLDRTIDVPVLPQIARQLVV